MISAHESGSAACSGMDVNIFFTQGEQCDNPGKRQQAKIKLATAVCARCVIRDECLQEAIDLGENLGIRGGLTSAERRKLLKE